MALNIMTLASRRGRRWVRRTDKGSGGVEERVGHPHVGEEDEGKVGELHDGGEEEQESDKVEGRG